MLKGKEDRERLGWAMPVVRESLSLSMTAESQATGSRERICADACLLEEHGRQRDPKRSRGGTCGAVRGW